jgi:hypothetical protein
MVIADGAHLSAMMAFLLVLGNDLTAGGAEPAHILLQAGVDLPAIRHKLFAEAIHVGLASRLLLLRALLGYRIRSRETKRCRYRNARSIPHSEIPLSDEGPARAGADEVV